MKYTSILLRVLIWIAHITIIQFIGDYQLTYSAGSILKSTIMVDNLSSVSKELSITPEPTSIYEITPSPSLTSTLIPAFSETPTPTLETSPVRTLDPISIYIPILYNQVSLEPTPATISQMLYCKSAGLPIPDNDLIGTMDSFEVNDERFILDMDVRLNLFHTWIGDLTIMLTHQETGTSITLLDRPGYPNRIDGCGSDDIEAILDDEISSPVENKCSPTPPAIGGIFIPQQPLAIFDGEEAKGKWVVRIIDQEQGDIGYLDHWCLNMTLSNSMVAPTPTPVIANLPESASIGTISGKPQSMPLDCESRSAVDWAAFFGTFIDEYEFFNSLPKSNNPDVGFVGDVFDPWGQIPPNSYGVHAEPVANLLHRYGLEAYAHRPLTWDELRQEIASGKPVVAWVIGNVVNGVPVYYQSSDNHISIVARFEHTVIVTGYSPDTVSYLNGSTIYSRSVEQFLDSWSALGNMAIATHP